MVGRDLMSRFTQRRDRANTRFHLAKRLVEELEREATRFPDGEVRVVAVLDHPTRHAEQPLPAVELVESPCHVDIFPRAGDFDQARWADDRSGPTSAETGLEGKDPVVGRPQRRPRDRPVRRARGR